MEGQIVLDMFYKKRRSNIPNYFLQNQQPVTKPAVAEPQKAKDLLDKSSDVNRNLGLISVGFMFYALVTTAGITDLQLVLQDQDKGISLPIVSITLPLMKFAYVAPLIVLGIHLNLLINLLEHAVKLNSWLETEKAKLETEDQQSLIQKQLQPFLFNYALAKRQSFFVFITKLLVNTSAFILPLATLYYIEYRFADVHDNFLTSYHYGFFLADALLVLAFYPAIFYPKLAIQNWKALVKRFLIYGLLPYKLVAGLVYLVISLLLIFIQLLDNVLRKTPFRIWARLRIWKIKHQRYSSKNILQHLSVTRMIDQTMFCFFIVASFLYFLIVRTITNPNKYKAVVAFVRGDSSKIIWKLYTDSANAADYDSSFIPGNSTIHRTWLPIPIINVAGQKLSYSTPSLQEILLAKQSGIKVDSLLLENTNGINLQGRDFSLANFKNCNLVKAQMDSANMCYANMEACNAASSSFQNAVLSYSRLQLADFRKGALDNIKLREADLSRAILQETNLLFAELQGCNLYYAKMQKANLYFSKLQGADLSSANLQGAFLSSAGLQVANLSSADLQGANLSHAEMQGAITMYTEFQGANFSFAKMQNADLSSANLRGAIFVGSHIRGMAFSLGDSLTNGMCVKKCDTIKYLTHPEVDSISKLMKHDDKERFIKIFLYETASSVMLPNCTNPTIITSERIKLIGKRAIKIEQILLNPYDYMDNSYNIILDSGFIFNHNQAILNACKFKKLTWRLEEIKKLDEIAFPGIK